MFLKICSFDLEILPLGEQMPSADRCPILLASCHFNYDYIIGNNKTRNIVFILTMNDERIEIQKERVVVYTKDETVIINNLFRMFKENDVWTGYNINNFDFVYLIDRAKVLGIRNIKIGLGDSNLYYRKHLAKGFTVTKLGGATGKIIFDVLMLMKREDESNVFKKKYNMKKLTLEHVSKEILGVEKKEFSIHEMAKYWENTDNVELRNKFINYCSRDSELALLFVTRHRLLDKFVTLSKASGRVIQEVINSMGSGVMVENLLLKEFKKYDRIVPIRMHKEVGYKNEDEEELSGAEVADPITGVSENLGSVDYKSLYPSLMIKHNLCYSTQLPMSDEEIAKLGLKPEDVEVMYDELGNPYAKFVRKETYVGIVPRKLTELLALRASQKKEMKKYEKDSLEYLMWDASQNATKILLNSFYGYSGDSDAKIYSWLVASSVTTNGRKQIKKTWHMITDEIVKVQVGSRWFTFRIVQGDTDSSYLQVISLDTSKEVSRDEVIKAISLVLEKVNATLEKPMSLDFENYIKRIVIVAKKRYAYLSIDDKGKESITSKGIETIRRDWCNFATNNMSKVVDYILKEKDVQDGVKKSLELIKEQVKKLNKGEVILNDLVLSKKLTKPITSYDGKAAHVQVAIRMKERGHASEIGDRIQYLILDNGKKLLSEKAEEANFVIQNLDKVKIDNNYYITHQLIPPSMRILSLLGVKEELLNSTLDERQHSLMDY